MNGSNDNSTRSRLAASSARAKMWPARASVTCNSNSVSSELPTAEAQQLNFPDYHRKFKQRVQQMPESPLKEAFITIMKV